MIACIYCVMSQELLLAFTLFALVSSITPGPNNLMLMASGANFGFRRSIPHMLGIGIGFVVLLCLVGAGLIRIFDAYPVVHSVLKVVSALYLLWLAWRIARATRPKSDARTATPLTFLQAAAFQWVNPKGWSMALTAISVYTPDTSLAAVAMVALIFGAINLPAVSCWTLVGQIIARHLSDPRHLRLFNRGMAGLLVLSLYPLLLA